MSSTDELTRQRDLLTDQIREASTSGDDQRREKLYAELEDVLRQLKEEQ